MRCGCLCHLRGTLLWHARQDCCDNTQRPASQGFAAAPAAAGEGRHCSAAVPALTSPHSTSSQLEPVGSPNAVDRESR